MLKEFRVKYVVLKTKVFRFFKNHPSHITDKTEKRSFNFNKLENLLNKYPHNKFLVTCLNETDQFKLTVLARKFQNLKIFGFWWFNNQKSIVTNLLKTRIELLGDNFILQHSDARVADQLIYKWNDFRAIYTNVLHEKFKELIVSGFKIKSENLEKYIYQQLNQSPDNYT